MPSTRAPKHLVFVSYSHRDRWIAKQCVRLIDEAAKGRVETFLYERDMEGGAPIPDSVRDAIIRCDEFVVLLTPASIGSVWVQNENGAAWGRKKLIVAIVDKIDPKKMPEIIGSHRAIDLNDFDRYLAELVPRTRRKR